VSWRVLLVAVAYADADLVRPGQQADHRGAGRSCRPRRRSTWSSSSAGCSGRRWRGAIPILAAVGAGVVCLFLGSGGVCDRAGPVRGNVIAIGSGVFTRS
jgi:hypothetical protein